MAATLGPSRGLYGYAKAVANSLKVSAGQNSRRIDGYRKYSGHPLQVSGTGGYCQGPASGGEGGDNPTAPESRLRLGPGSLEVGRTWVRLGSRPLRP